MLPSTTDNDFRRAVVRRCALGSALICLAFLVVNAARGTWSGVLVDLLVGSGALAAWWLAGRTSHVAALGLGLAAAVLAAVVPLALTGAVQTWFWPLVVPMFLFQFAGPRKGLVLTVLVGIGMAVLLALRPPTRILPYLPASILGSFVLLSLVAWSYEQARHRDQIRLQELAHTDPLTGCANRRRLLAFLDYEIRRCRRYGLPLAVVVFDLDHFKEINDRHGHATGDAALRGVADRVRSVARDTDLLARTGGDEFVLVCPQIPAGTLRAGEGAAALAERVRQAVSEVVLPGGTRPSVIIGVASFEPEDDIDRLLDRADRALYATRRLGRNRVGVAPPPAGPATRSADAG